MKHPGWKKLLASLERQGWRVKPTKAGVIAYPPDKTKTPVTLHRTPSDRNIEHVVLRQLRARGYKD